MADTRGPLSDFPPPEDRLLYRAMVVEDGTIVGAHSVLPLSVAIATSKIESLDARSHHLSSRHLFSFVGTATVLNKPGFILKKSPQ